MIDVAGHSEQVAPTLLGCTLVSRGSAAVIVEVEAYHQDDPASHSFGGRPTPRTEVMFRAGGALYVYFTYGVHWCANVVTGVEGEGEAVLLRAGVPVRGEALMRERRGRDHDTANGPARLVQALGIEPSDNGAIVIREDITSVDVALEQADRQPLLVRDVEAAADVGIELPLDDSDILVGPRIGITKAVDVPWRFGVRGVDGLSKPFPAGA